GGRVVVECEQEAGQNYQHQQQEHQKSGHPFHGGLHALVDGSLLSGHVVIRVVVIIVGDAGSGELQHAAVDAVTQLLARLEVRHVLAAEHHWLTGLGVAAGTRRAVVKGKTSKAPDLDATAFGKHVGHVGHDGLDRQFDVLGGKLRVLGSNLLYQL